MDLIHELTQGNTIPVIILIFMGSFMFAGFGTSLLLDITAIDHVPDPDLVMDSSMIVGWIIFFCSTVIYFLLRSPKNNKNEVKV